MGSNCNPGSHAPKWLPHLEWYKEALLISLPAGVRVSQVSSQLQHTHVGEDEPKYMQIYKIQYDTQ